MPEKARRRAKKKRAAPADFAKARGEVGRAKRAPENETRPEFRTRRLAVAGQSVAKETAGAAVSGRNLTVPELLAQLGHPSAKVRADAAGGLVEILEGAPVPVGQQLGPLLGALAPRMLDPERPTRRAALRLLKALGAEPGCRRRLPAFLPVLMTTTQAALTHVELPIRTDALGFLDALLEALPAEATAPDYWGPCLSHFQDLLAPQNRHDSLKRRSLAFIARASACCRRYLSAAERPCSVGGSGGRGVWHRGACIGSFLLPHMEPGRAMKAEVAAKDAALQLCAGCGVDSGLPNRLRSRQAVPPRKKRRAPPSSRKKMLKVFQGPPGDPDVDGVSAGTGGIELRLLSTLIDCWSECHPSELLGEGAEPASVKILADLLMCIRHLACPRPGLRLAAWGQSARGRLLTQLAPHFPARVASEVTPPETITSLAEFNLAAAEVLACLVSPAGTATSGPPDGNTWVPRVERFYVNLIARGRLLEAEPVLGAVELEGPTASPEMISLALGAAIMLLERLHAGADVGSAGAAGDAGARNGLIQAVAALLARLSPEDPLFGETLSCLGSLLDRDRGHRGGASGSVPAALLEVWLTTVPRALWKMGSKEPAVSLRALKLSLEVLRRSEAATLAASAEEIQLSLAPLFCAILPPRSSSKSGSRPGPRVVWGPLRDLPTGCQDLAVDLLHFLPSIDAELVRAVLLGCLSEQGLSTDCACRAVQALHTRNMSGGDHSKASEEVRLSFLVTLLAGRSSLAGSHALGPDTARNKGENCSYSYWDRHMALLQVALECVEGGRRGAPGGGSLLAQSLLQHAGDPNSARRLQLGFILFMVSEMYAGVPLPALFTLFQSAGGEHTQLPHALFSSATARRLEWLKPADRAAKVARILAEYALVTASATSLPETPETKTLSQTRGPALAPFFLALQGPDTEVAAVVQEVCDVALGDGVIDADGTKLPGPPGGPEDTSTGFQALERGVRALSAVQVLQGVCTRTPCLLGRQSTRAALDQAVGRLRPYAAEERCVARGLEYIRGTLQRHPPCAMTQ